MYIGADSVNGKIPNKFKIVVVSGRRRMAMGLEDVSAGLSMVIITPTYYRRGTSC